MSLVVVIAEGRIVGGAVAVVEGEGRTWVGIQQVCGRRYDVFGGCTCECAACLGREYVFQKARGAAVGLYMLIETAVTQHRLNLCSVTVRLRASVGTVFVKLVSWSWLRNSCLQRGMGQVPARVQRGLVGQASFNSMGT
jgi:hypothetical protein